MNSDLDIRGSFDLSFPLVARSLPGARSARSTVKPDGRFFPRPSSMPPEGWSVTDIELVRR